MLTFLQNARVCSLMYNSGGKSLLNLIKFFVTPCCNCLKIHFLIIFFLAGIMNHASVYPCIFCRKCRNKRGDWVGDGTLRTWKSIITHKTEWETIGKGKKSTRQQFYNCIHDPLIGDGSDEPILDTVAPPALHLKLSLNSILETLLDIWPELEIYAEMIHLVYAPYHGKVLGKGST